MLAFKAMPTQDKDKFSARGLAQRRHAGLVTSSPAPPGKTVVVPKRRAT